MTENLVTFITMYENIYARTSQRMNCSEIIMATLSNHFLMCKTSRCIFSEKQIKNNELITLFYMVSV